MLSSKFWRFEDMVTLRVVPIIYVVGVVCISLVTLLLVISGTIAAKQFVFYTIGVYQDAASTLLGLLIALVAGALFFLLSNLSWRLLCEGMVVFFKMWENTKALQARQ